MKPETLLPETGNLQPYDKCRKIREALNKAKVYKAKIEAAGDDASKLPAYDQKSEALIPVLNHEIPLKAHAHQANDIFTAIRIAKEFGVGLTLEHVTEGHMIVDELAKENLPLAVGPTFGHASKFELRIRPGRHLAFSRKPDVMFPSSQMPVTRSTTCRSAQGSLSKPVWTSMRHSAP